MATETYRNPYDIIKVPRFEEQAGFYTTKQRSNTMSKITSKNSKPEMRLRKALWKEGIRYRIHIKYVPGSPDIFIGKYRLAIFVDGSFWHGYQWEKRKQQIKSNRAFWLAKIERNIQRDQQNRQALENAGYTVMRFWEHEVKDNLSACVNQVKLYIEAVRDMKRIPGVW